ncbi:hypothetical protein RSAG8_06195, partial [Rhizoctonia solani AG-8 WAC10335]
MDQHVTKWDRNRCRLLGSATTILGHISGKSARPSMPGNPCTRIQSPPQRRPIYLGVDYNTGVSLLAFAVLQSDRLNFDGGHSVIQSSRNRPTAFRGAPCTTNQLRGIQTQSFHGQDSWYLVV